jgi:hypothetical protein
MKTHELIMNYRDDGPKEDVAALNSATPQKHVRWSVIRMKLRNCACYPIHLNFETPLTEAEVREKIAEWVGRGDREWREFRHFDVWPTPS